MKLRHWLLPLLLAISASALAANEAPPLHIGLSVSDLGNPFFTELARGAEAEARRLWPGPVRLDMVSSAYDEGRQIQQIEQFTTTGVDLILLVATSADGLGTAIQHARDSGIPVLAIDVAARHADLSITTDNRQAGEIACAYLARQLGARGNIAIINGPPVASVIERVQGCQSTLAQSPQIRLLSSQRNGGGSRQGGLEVMTHLLTEFETIDAVFAINDPTALGAEQAARLSGRQFLIVSVDGSPAIRERLQQGNSPIIASASQSPNAIARTAIREGIQRLQGKSASSGLLQLPSHIIDRETVKQAEEW